MGHLQANEMAAHADREIALRWHLTANHFPPIPISMIPVCIEALDHADLEDWEAEIDLPEGTLYLGHATAPVWAIIEQHHLEAFLSVED